MSQAGRRPSTSSTVQYRLPFGRGTAGFDVPGVDESPDMLAHVTQGLKEFRATSAASTELFGESDEKSLGSPDVAEPIHVLVLDHFAADKLRAMLTEPDKRFIEVVHGEHDAQVAEGVHRGAPVISDHWRREKPRQLESAVTVRCAHHGDLDALARQSSDTP
jgi:hypothetical protein